MTYKVGDKVVFTSNTRSVMTVTAVGKKRFLIEDKDGYEYAPWIEDDGIAAYVESWEKDKAYYPADASFPSELFRVTATDDDGNALIKYTSGGMTSFRKQEARARYKEFDNA